jgi:hypothetical protein
MVTRARQIVVFAVIAALAVANGFTPRHAQAASEHHMQPQSAASHDHDMAKPLPAELAGAARCHDDGEPARTSAFPDSNCCVASCSAAAFIFTTIAFDQSLPRETYSLRPARALTPPALIADDPPPR